MSGSGSDDLFAVTELPHIDVSLVDSSACILAENRMHIFSGIADVLSEYFFPIGAHTK